MESAVGLTAALSAGTAILFGLAPAWQVSRSCVHDTLKESGRGSSSGASRHRILSGLVTTEIALFLTYVIGVLCTRDMYRGGWLLIRALSSREGGVGAVRSRRMP